MLFTLVKKRQKNEITKKKATIQLNKFQFYHNAVRALIFLPIKQCSVIYKRSEKKVTTTVHLPIL